MKAAWPHMVTLYWPLSSALFGGFEQAEIDGFIPLRKAGENLSWKKSKLKNLILKRAKEPLGAGASHDGARSAP